ncbi:MAG: bifunctional DNA-formamidopyrimidine glycosylase/DNA-(apurinic or apyrimidinic site) lyase [Dehalococcoidia bacterium]
MPELPEVETIRKALIPLITGTRVKSVELLWPKAVRQPSPEEFCQQIAGQRIEGIRRRGKYFLFDLSGGEILGLHLKMTGVLLLEPASKEVPKHTVAIFRLDGDSDLHFVDQRKFGSIWLAGDEKEIIGKLGPEPLDKAFTQAYLSKLTRRHSIPIKALLHDQNAIAGIGNMYADEALFAAKIHPLKKASSLSGREIKKLHTAIIEVLERGIRHNGASTRNYRLPDGSEGLAHTQFRVAHRGGKPCPVCGTAISRISIRGRGSYFCPKCQPKSRRNE